MNSTQQKCFLEAAQCLNFTTAAERLFISQPALSRNISSLEDELEILLFVRHNNVLSLTAGGEIIYKWMKDAETGFNATLKKARKANSEPRDELRLGFVRSELPLRIDADAITAFKAENPEVDVSITHYTAKEIVQSLVEHRIDIALMIGSAVYGNPRLQCVKFAASKRCLTVSINHPLAGADSASLSQLAGECFISVEPLSSPTMTPMIQQACKAAGFNPRIIEAASTEEQVSWVESGKGAALLIDNHIERHNPFLSFIELEENLTVSQMCTWDKLNVNPNISEFIDILMSLAQSSSDK